MKALEDVFSWKTMPHEMGFDYSFMSFPGEKSAGRHIAGDGIRLLAAVCVPESRGALAESWSLPFSVLLSTPVAIFGAFAVLWLRRTLLGYFEPAYMVQIENDVYSQIGLVMLIGLAAKNAILIVEFAKDAFENGKPLVEAALEGARLRLRPITWMHVVRVHSGMCSFVGMRRARLGRRGRPRGHDGRSAGISAESVIGIFFIPAIFYVVEKVFWVRPHPISGRRSRHQSAGGPKWRGSAEP